MKNEKKARRQRIVDNPVTELTNIRLTKASVHYKVHLEPPTSIKEWAVKAGKALSRRGKKSDIKLVQALHEVDLEVAHGEKLGIIGLNGAGKTTMLKLMSGLIRPSSGSIEVTGKISPLLSIGAGFNNEFTGRENIYFNGAMLGFKKKEIKEFERSVIDFSELEDAIDMPVKYYSSGMVARLAFSIATTIKPEILVLDEMLSAGDVSFVDKARGRMMDLVDNAKMLIIVSHNLGLVQDLCTRAVMLDKGEIVYRGTPDDTVAFYKERAKAPPAK